MPVLSGSRAAESAGLPLPAGERNGVRGTRELVLNCRNTDECCGVVTGKWLLACARAAKDLDVFKDTKVLVMGRFLAGLGSGLLVLSSWVSPVLAEPLPCWSVRHEGSDYTVCEVDLRRQLLKFFWKRPDGQPYRYLSSLPRSLGSQSGRLLFALNAGMYHPD